MTVISVDPFALKATAIATTALATKSFLTMLALGGARFKSGGRPPEDVVMMPKAGPQSFDGSDMKNKKDSAKYEEARLTELRWVRIMANDLENIPLGLIIAWGTLLCTKNPVAHGCMALTFAGARILHTICYVTKIPQLRAISWITGVACFLGMSINGLLGALKMSS